MWGLGAFHFRAPSRLALCYFTVYMQRPVSSQSLHQILMKVPGALSRLGFFSDNLPCKFQLLQPPQAPLSLSLLTSSRSLCSAPRKPGQSQDLATFVTLSQGLPSCTLFCSNFCIFIYTYVYVCTYIHTLPIYTYIFIYMYIYIHMNICICIVYYIFVYLYTYVYLYSLRSFEVG